MVPGSEQSHGVDLPRHGACGMTQLQGKEMTPRTCCSVQSLTLSQKGKRPVSSWYIMMPALHVSHDSL